MKNIDHIAVAVPDLDQACRFYEALLGSPCEGTETVPEQKVRVAFFRAGGTRIELLQPIGPDSPVAGFLARGPGLHHICLAVDDLGAEMARLRAAGSVFIDPEPRAGSHGSRVAFIHPRSSGGVLTELLEPAKEDRASAK